MFTLMKRKTINKFKFDFIAMKECFGSLADTRLLLLFSGLDTENLLRVVRQRRTVTLQKLHENMIRKASV